MYFYIITAKHMFTTVSFYTCALRPEHKYIQTHFYTDGYGVEDEGVFFGKLDEYVKRQNARFYTDAELVAIAIINENNQTVITLKR